MMWKTWFLMCSVCAVFLSYRIYVVLHRDIPSDVENRETVRWLDEAGRLANTLTWICYHLGIELATWPVKMVVNFSAKLLLNGFGNTISNMTVRYTSVDGVPVTIFLPDSLHSERKYLTMVYIHGGGWTWFSVDVYAGYLANLATKTKVQLIAVEYRKAPKHSFPSAYDDCLTVTNGLLKRTEDFKIREGKLIIAGDGAGGNLAAAVSQATKDKLFMQILVSPALQILDFETPSYQDNVETLPGLTSAFRNVYNWLTYTGISKDYLQMALQNNHISSKVRNSVVSLYVDSKRYLPSYHKVTKKQTKLQRGSTNFLVSSAFSDISSDSRLAPMMQVHLEGIPNTYMITSQYDVYRDEAIMFVHRLFDAGVKVKLEHYFGTFHGFMLFSGYGPIKFDISDQALSKLSAFIESVVSQ